MNVTKITFLSIILVPMLQNAVMDTVVFIHNYKTLYDLHSWFLNYAAHN
jgi:hypothetical protein